MNLQVGAAYLPDANEVQVAFSSTLDDLTTVTVADSVTLTLLSQSTNLNGTPQYNTIQTISTDSQYVQPTQQYAVRFRNPGVRMDLWVSVNAIYSGVPYTTQVAVGESISPNLLMDLPDNKLYGKDVFDFPATGGPADTVPDRNITILPPELQNYYDQYDFTNPSSDQADFSSLQYSGGGNRLLMDSLNNQFVLQPLNDPPWSLNAYLFMEPAVTNLIQNPFFQNVQPPTANGSPPVGWSVDGAGALLTQTVAFDYATSTAAQIWTARFQQNNFMTAFNLGDLTCTESLPVTPQYYYSFSAYIQTLNNNTGSKVPEFLLTIQWFDGTDLISENSQTYSVPNFPNLSLASVTGWAPIAATSAQVSIQVGPIDAGDDISISVFCPQFEQSQFPSSRVVGSRLVDLIQSANYDPTNQKIRIQTMMGFDGGSGTYQMLTGPLTATFTPTATIQVSIPSAAVTLEVPLAFANGDLLDLTIDHQSGKNLTLYQSGMVIGQAALPVFSAAPQTLNLNGIGVEVLNLLIFSRA